MQFQVRMESNCGNNLSETEEGAKIRTRQARNADGIWFDVRFCSPSMNKVRNVWQRLRLIGRNVVSEGETWRKATPVRARNGWNSTVLHPALHPRLDRIPSLSTLLCFQSPRLTLFIPYERIYFRDVEISSCCAVSHTFSTVWQGYDARAEIADKLDGIKFPLRGKKKKDRGRNLWMEYFRKYSRRSVYRRSHPPFGEVERLLKSFLPRISCIPAREQVVWIFVFF